MTACADNGSDAVTTRSSGAAAGSESWPAIARHKRKQKHFSNPTNSVLRLSSLDPSAPLHAHPPMHLPHLAQPDPTPYSAKEIHQSVARRLYAESRPRSTADIQRNWSNVQIQSRGIGICRCDRRLRRVRKGERCITSHGQETAAAPRNTSAQVSECTERSAALLPLGVMNTRSTQ